MQCSSYCNTGTLPLADAGKRRILIRLAVFLLMCAAFFCAFEQPAAAATAKKVSTETVSGGKWVKKSGKWKYRRANKTYVTGKFLKTGGKMYYMDADGYARTGWFTVDGGRFYGAKTAGAGKNGKLYSGWHKIGGKYYYFFKNKTTKHYFGQAATGWQKLGNNIYYFAKTGEAYTGWKKIGGQYFYFQPKGVTGACGKMMTGWVTIGNKKYYLRPTGKLGVKGARYASEWVTIDKKQYYLDKNGSLYTDVMTEDQFLSTIAPLAKKDMKTSRILASVTIAQAILESGWCTSSLGIEAKNLFGMKATLSGNTWASAWTGKTFEKVTMEYLNGKWISMKDTFRAYDNFAQSVADHSAYLRGAKKGDGTLRYKGLVGCKDYKKALHIIKAGGYATAPNYESVLISIIQRYNLTKYDK